MMKQTGLLLGFNVFPQAVDSIIHNPMQTSGERSVFVVSQTRDKLRYILYSNNPPLGTTMAIPIYNPSSGVTQTVSEFTNQSSVSISHSYSYKPRVIILDTEGNVIFGDILYLSRIWYQLHLSLLSPVRFICLNI